jgi:hypothetical protein
VIMGLDELDAMFTESLVHLNVSVGLPFEEQLNVTLDPSNSDWLTGWTVMSALPI